MLAGSVVGEATAQDLVDGDMAALLQEGCVAPEPGYRLVELTRGATAASFAHAKDL
jgi:hypothetical protein